MYTQGRHFQQWREDQSNFSWAKGLNNKQMSKLQLCYVCQLGILTKLPKKKNGRYLRLIISLLTNCTNSTDRRCPDHASCHNIKIFQKLNFSTEYVFKYYELCGSGTLVHYYHINMIFVLSKWDEIFQFRSLSLLEKRPNQPNITAL
jgi:hypothetical protein